MFMKKQLSFATVVVALTAIAAPVGAGVITFDDSYANSILYDPFTNGQSFSDGGLTFTSQGQNSLLYVWDSGSPNSNGTNNAILGFGEVDYLTITKTGGGAFNLNSLDMSISWYNNNIEDTILINSSPITLIQGIQTYTLNLYNVTQVNISGVLSNSGYWLLDNVDYNETSVPEPASLALLGIGLAGLGFMRRRQPA